MSAVPPLDIRIRLAMPGDLPAISAIYNHYVLHSTATYQTEPSTAAERESWYAAHGPAYPVLVAEPGPGAAPGALPPGWTGGLLGWASLSPFHARCAYRFTVEDSVYIHPACQRRGIGQALLSELIARARGLGHHSIIALISADQAPSLALHGRFGFAQAGLLRQVGWKFERWLDVAYLQLILTEP